MGHKGNRKEVLAGPTQVGGGVTEEKERHRTHGELAESTRIHSELEEGTSLGRKSGQRQSKVRRW